MPRMPRTPAVVRRPGFTLVELMVVIAVIAVITALMLPAVQQARESARRTQCRNNLKQLGIALHNYHNVFRTFPAGAYGNLTEAYFQTGALVALLPYLEQANLADTYNYSLDWEDPANNAAVVTPVRVFVCPSASQMNPATSTTWQQTIACPCIDWPDRFGLTNYLLSKGPGDSWCEERTPGNRAGMFELNHPVRVADITDGTSNTLCMGEGSCSAGWNVCEVGNCPTPAIHPVNGEVFRPLNPWATSELITTGVKNLAGMVATSTWGSTQRPMNENPVVETYASTANGGQDQHDCRDSSEGGPHSTSGFRSDHSGGSIFLLADGSVHFLNEQVDRDTWQALSTRSGEEVIAFQ